jgi:hypothetical protein
MAMGPTVLAHVAGVLKVPLLLLHLPPSLLLPLFSFFTSDLESRATVSVRSLICAVMLSS